MRPVILTNSTEDTVAIWGNEHNGNKKHRLAFSVTTGWFIADVVKTYGWKLADENKPDYLELKEEIESQGYSTDYVEVLVQEEIIPDPVYKLVGRARIVGMSSNMVREDDSQDFYRLLEKLHEEGLLVVERLFVPMDILQRKEGFKMESLAGDFMVSRWVVITLMKDNTKEEARHAGRSFIVDTRGALVGSD